MSLSFEKIRRLRVLGSSAQKCLEGDVQTLSSQPANTPRRGPRGVTRPKVSLMAVSIRRSRRLVTITFPETTGNGTPAPTHALPASQPRPLLLHDPSLSRSLCTAPSTTPPPASHTSPRPPSPYTGFSLLLISFPLLLASSPPLQPSTQHPLLYQHPPHFPLHRFPSLPPRPPAALRHPEKQTYSRHFPPALLLFEAEHARVATSFLVDLVYTFLPLPPPYRPLPRPFPGQGKERQTSNIKEKKAITERVTLLATNLFPSPPLNPLPIAPPLHLFSPLHPCFFAHYSVRRVIEIHCNRYLPS